MLGWIASSSSLFFHLFLITVQYSTVHVRGTGDIVPAAFLFTQKSHPPQRLPVPLKWDILSWGINWMNQTQRCRCCFSLAMPSYNNTFMLLSQHPALTHQPHLSQEHQAGGLLCPRSGLGGWDKDCLLEGGSVGLRGLVWESPASLPNTMKPPGLWCKWGGGGKERKTTWREKRTQRRDGRGEGLLKQRSTEGLFKSRQQWVSIKRSALTMLGQNKQG